MSDSRIFGILLFANAKRCDIAGYRQWLEAFDGEGNLAGVWNHEPTAGNLPHCEMRVLVMSRLVRSPSGTAVEAMRLFDEWHAKGYPETWLMNPNET